jgi:hypothetical protein
MPNMIAVLLLVATMGLHAQIVTPEIFGRVTDPEGGVLPGVQVVVVGGRTQREAVTDTSGRFEISGLALGTYRLETKLAGFVTRSGSITLSSATPRAQISWSMEVGCLVEDVRILHSPQDAARLVEAVVHLRVEHDRGLLSWSSRPECSDVLQSYSTVVLNEKPQRAMDVLLRTVDVRLHPGREYLAFIWPGSRTGDHLVFPVESGRVASTAPAPLGGMRVDEALALINVWAKRPPRRW